jgi:hypothetical protein
MISISIVLRSFVPGIGLVAKILSHLESWNFGWLYLLILSGLRSESYLSALRKAAQSYLSALRKAAH